MEIIRRDSDYALQCLAHLAELNGQWRSVRQIAAADELPEALLRKVLQKLVRAGLVDSAKGVNGGFRLARPPAQISVGEVLAAVQGPVRLNRCLGGGVRCRRQRTCGLHAGLIGIQEEIDTLLAQMTLADILRRDTGTEVGALP